MLIDWQRFLKVFGFAFVVVAVGLLLVELVQVARTNAPWERAVTNWKTAVFGTQFVVYALMGIICGVIADRSIK